MRVTNALVAVAALSSSATATALVKRQNLDLGAILGAPAATVTGPPLSAINDTGVINTAAIVASISAAVTNVATAQITGAAASNAANIAPTVTAAFKRDAGYLEKRDLEKRSFLDSLLSWLGATLQKLQTAQATTAKTTTTSASSTSARTTTTSSPSTTSSSTVATSTSSAALQTGGFGLPGGAPSVTATTTAVSVSSVTTTSSGACPTTPEDGTYCGFINPEDPCAPQPDGAGPAINTPDTTDAWYNYAPFQTMAAKAATPSGYAKTFSNMNASSSASSYMGLWTLTSYDTAQCASLCNNNTGCTAFNIYIERDPSLNPCKNDSSDPTVWGYWCPMPKSITNYKCTLWGSNLDASTATNAGGWRKDFPVVITGSNGYDKTNATTPVSVPTYDPPKNCSGKAIYGGSYWLGSKFFPGAFNPSACAAYANATTSCNKKAAIAANQTTYTPCQMFNAYHIYKNSVPMGTYCSLYNAQLSTDWATLSGSYSGRDWYGVRNSWQYQLTTPDSGKCGGR